MKASNPSHFISLFVASFFAAATTIARGNPLQGDAKTAGRPSVLSAGSNPAQAALLPKSEADVSTSLYQSDQFKQRFPGFDPITKENQSFLNILSLSAGVVFKLSPRFALGITGFEPPISTDIKVKDLPIVLLGQPNFVDLNIHVQLNGGFTTLLAYRLSKTLALGAKVQYASRQISASATPSDGGPEVLNYSQSDTHMAIALGTTWDVARTLTLGASMDAVGYSQSQTELSSPLLPKGSGDGNKATGGFTVATPLENIRLGLGWQAAAPIFLLTDLEYHRASAQTAFSLVELKEKPKDTYDTLSLSVGAEYAGLESGEFLAGYHYEPSGVGAGGKGEGSKTGFGTFESLPVYTGQGSLTPYHAYSGGFRFHFLAAKDGRDKDSKEKDTEESSSMPDRKAKWPKNASKSATRYRLTVETGFVFQTASLGIDETGEQPAAYSQTKLTIPLRLYYSF